MTTVARRTSSPMAEMLDWFERNSPFSLRAEGIVPYVRIEDFMEEGEYVLRAELPGIDPEKDVEVTVEDDVMTIQGERREETREKSRREFHYGSFSRSVSLPRGAGADQIKASYTDGVLEVRVPLAVEEPHSVRVPVQRSE